MTFKSPTDHWPPIPANDPEIDIYSKFVNIVTDWLSSRGDKKPNSTAQIYYLAYCPNELSPVPPIRQTPLLSLRSWQRCKRLIINRFYGCKENSKNHEKSTSEHPPALVPGSLGIIQII
jgi:hypothetical protein